MPRSFEGTTKNTKNPRIKPRRDDKGIHIGPQNTSFGCTITLVNPENRAFVETRFVISFGAYGSTRLMVWEDSLDDALETAAEWLADHAPGLIMEACGEDHKGLIREVCEEREISYPEGFDALGDEAKWEICEQAEADLTMTESGFIPSYEWFVTAENPSRAEIVDLLYPPGMKWGREDGYITR